MTDNTNAYKDLAENSNELYHLSEDEHWINLAEITIQLRARMTKVMNIQIS